MHTQNRPFSEKNLKKIFLTLKIALKTQKSRPAFEPGGNGEEKSQKR